jgi:SpoVK/Ycf46/Vps4 family AAA+-type ATPase
VLEKERRAIFWKSISSVEMLSRVVGGAEEFISNIFADLKKSKPAILAIEDIHLLFGVKEVGTHETVLATLLSELDRLVWEEVVVVATYCSDRELSKNIRSSGKF